MICKDWNILCWNVRGINSDKKWNAIRDKVVESNCDIICLQETKREHCDLKFIKQFCPVSFDKFEFLPSMGASGGIITIWKSKLFEGNLAFSNPFSLSVEFRSKHNNEEWILTNVYAPCTPDGKRIFTDWMKQIQMPEDQNWVILGDFNLMRDPSNRNKPGADLNEIFMFNETISSLGLVEINLDDRLYTWSNKQVCPLMKKLDWCFTSQAWTLSYPNTSIKSLVHETSDHVPLVISVGTSIPRSNVFRFENYWMEHEHFWEIVQHGWSVPTFQTDKAKVITAKFKNLRRVLRAWQSNISSLKSNIDNVKLVLHMLLLLQEMRDLSVQEWNFLCILEDKLISLLKQQRIYWK